MRRRGQQSGASRVRLDDSYYFKAGVPRHRTDVDDYSAELIAGDRGCSVVLTRLELVVTECDFYTCHTPGSQTGGVSAGERRDENQCCSGWERSSDHRTTTDPAIPG